MNSRLKLAIEVVVVILIIGLGAFLRFADLNQLPFGVYPDEAANGNDANQIIQHPVVKVFLENNGGREGLFIYLIALSFKLFGSSIASIHLVSALIGTLTLIFFYLLAKELLGRKLGIVGLFFFTISTWHLTFSHDGFRAILVPFLTCAFLYFLVKAWRSKKTVFWIFTGIALGLGIYTYIAFRFVPVIIFVILVYKYLIQKSAVWKMKSVKKGIIIFLIALVLTTTPFLIHSIFHPLDFVGRAGGVSIFNPGLQQGGFIKTALGSFIKTLGMFNFAGDNNWRHNLSGEPMLNFWVGLLMLWGLLITIINFKKTKYFLILAGFFVMMVPAMLTAEGVPHALRAIGTLPFIYLLVALPFKYFFRAMQTKKMILPHHKGGALRRMAVVKVIIIILGIGFAGSITYDSYKHYFVTYAEKEQVYSEFRGDLRDVGEYLNRKQYNRPLIIALDQYSNQSLEFITYQKTAYTLFNGDSKALDTLLKKQKTTCYFVVTRDFFKVTDESKLLKRYSLIDQGQNRFDQTIFKIYFISHDELRAN